MNVLKLANKAVNINNNIAKFYNECSKEITKKTGLGVYKVNECFFINGKEIEKIKVDYIPFYGANKVIFYFYGGEFIELKQIKFSEVIGFLRDFLK